ncbi:hypothetical protein EFL96_08975 [Lactococcus lactis]|nr:hypothetical protein [Lactococcus lactis]MCT1190068.1 hypothetical protein [Lactococcus lactis]
MAVIPEYFHVKPLNLVVGSVSDTTLPGSPLLPAGPSLPLTPSLPRSPLTPIIATEYPVSLVLSV